MGKLGYWALVGFFGAIIAGIVFVKAGRGGGVSGGDQVANIIKAGGTSTADVASALEGS